MKESKAIRLDYVMALPKKITDQLIKQTRQKLLKGHAAEIQEKLGKVRNDYYHENGLEMSEDDQKKVLNQIKQEMYSDQ